MPDIDSTNAGTAAIAAAVQVTHWQIGRDRSADIPNAVAVPGAFRSGAAFGGPMSMGNIIQAVLVDENEAIEYDDCNSVGFWIGDPTDNTSILAALYSTPAGFSFSKTTIVNLIIEFNWTVSAQHMANISFAYALPQFATESNAGLIEIATQDEVDAETDDSRAVTPLKLRRWFNQLVLLASHIPELPISKITGLAAALAAKANFAQTVTMLVDQATITWNFNLGTVATVTLSGNRTLALPTNGTNNVLYLLRVTQDATGSRTLTLHASIGRLGQDQPELRSGAGQTTLLGFMKWDGAVYYIGSIGE